MMVAVMVNVVAVMLMLLVNFVGLDRSGFGRRG
jgi:hypothetical protein